MTTYLKQFSVSTDTMSQTINAKGVSFPQYNAGDVNTDMLSLTLTHQNTVMDLTNATVSVVFQKPDGKIVYQDTTSGVTVTNATQGQLTVSINTQTRAVPGVVIGAVRVTYPGNQIIETEKFSFNVEASLASDQAILSANSIPSLVLSVNGVKPDSSGNVAIPTSGVTINDSSTTSTTQTWSANQINNQLSSVNASLASRATDVKSFGAKGDGVTNDLTAFNNAMTNANAPLYLPKGTYIINGDLYLTHSLIGCGMDSVIYIQSGRIRINSDNIEIANLKIHSFKDVPIYVHGNTLGIWVSQTNYTVGTQINVLNNVYQCTAIGAGNSTVEPSGTSTTPVAYGDGYSWEYVGPVTRWNDIKVHDVYSEFDSSVTSNFLTIDAYYTNNLKIYNNHFTKGGIQLVQSSDFDVHDNYLDGLNANDNELCQASTKSYGIINNNFFYNSNTDPLDLYSSGEMCIVTNNKFKGINLGSGSDSGCVIECKIELRDPPYTGGSSDQDEYGSFQNTIISNNIITDANVLSNGNFTGIMVNYVDDRASASYDVTKAARHVIIKGNIIKDFDVNHNNSLTGVYMSAISYKGVNGVISNNVIKNITTHGNPNWTTCGIYLGYADTATTPAINDDAIGCIVSNNFINTEASGIVVDYAERCTINGNIIRKDEATGIDPKYGLYIRYSLLDSAINNNVFDCGASNANGIMLTSTTTTVSRCTFEGNVFTRSIGNTLSGMDWCSFIGNTFNMPVSIGISSVKYCNKFVGNTFNMASSSSYPIAADNQKGLIVTSNTFNNSNYALLVQDASNSCIIQNNISKSQIGATFTRYLNVATADQSSCIDNNNILVS